jgi:hypothetical protein
MGVEIRVTRNFGSLEDLELISAEDMRELGLQARELIVRRTLQGVDADGQPFASYSTGYAKRKRQALGTDQVNLQVSGNMLNQINITAVECDGTSGHVKLGWNL